MGLKTASHLCLLFTLLAVGEVSAEKIPQSLYPPSSHTCPWGLVSLELLSKQQFYWAVLLFFNLIIITYWTLKVVLWSLICTRNVSISIFWFYRNKRWQTPFTSDQFKPAVPYSDWALCEGKRNMNLTLLACKLIPPTTIDTLSTAF